MSRRKHIMKNFMSWVTQKISVNHTSDKGLVYKIYKEFSKLNYRKKVV